MSFSDTRAVIPVFPLYGEEGRWERLEPLHCEEIAARSALHDWEILPHRHDDLAQLLHIASGDATVSLDGRVRRAHGPALVFVPARVVHGFAFDPRVKGHVITLPVPVLRRLGAATGPMPDAPLLMDLAGTPASEDIAQHVTALAEEFATARPGRPAALEARLTLLLLALARHHSGQTDEHRVSRHEERANRFYELVEEGFLEHRSVDDYAGRLGITAVQLNKSLKTATGKPALAIIHERLVLEAKRNLLYTNSSVTEIAMQLGFGDPAYFSRFFTREAGQPPRDFRRDSLRAMRVG